MGPVILFFGAIMSLSSWFGLRSGRWASCVFALVGGFVLVGLSRPAAGQPAPSGAWILSFSLGAGALRTRDGSAESESAPRRFVRVALPNLAFGKMVSSRTALLVAIPTGAHLREGKLRSFESIQPAIQWWPTNRAWVRAGAGLGMDIPVIGTARTGFHFGWATSLTLGGVVATPGRTHVEIQTRLMHGVTALDGGERRSHTAAEGMLGFTFRAR